MAQFVYYPTLSLFKMSKDCVELLLGMAEMTYLSMCEHPGEVLAEYVHSFEADLGREDCLHRRRNCLNRSC